MTPGARRDPCVLRPASLLQLCALTRTYTRADWHRETPMYRIIHSRIIADSYDVPNKIAEVLIVVISNVRKEA